MAENMDDDEGTSVEVFVYDLSRGMAAVMSHMLIGRQLEGIWHTAIVAYGREYFFGPQGIQSVRPGGTELQEPLRIEKIGQTYLPYSVFWEYINGLGTTKFAPGTYNLLRHNCNNFTDEVSSFLVGTGIPKYILDLPEEIIQTPVGQALLPLIENLSKGATAGFNSGQRFVEARISREESPTFHVVPCRLNSIILDEKRSVLNAKIAKRKQRKVKKEKKKKDRQSRENGSESNSGLSNCTDMAENGETVATEKPVKSKKSSGHQQQADGFNGEAASGSEPRRVASPDEIAREIDETDEEERRRAEEARKRREPPIVFKDLPDAAEELQLLRDLLGGKLTEDEEKSIDELYEYLLKDEGSWALGDNFLTFVGRIFRDGDLDAKARICLANILCIAALKDDVILLLHQDRREHSIMNFAYDIDRHPIEEQLPLAQFIANLFENLSSSEWLMYISEWQHQNQSISNIRVTTKVAVHALLSDSEELQARGAAIIHNLCTKEVKTVVFDDVAVELTMALLQFFNGNPEEKHLYACMKSLERLTEISRQEVPQLIHMIGPEPSKFKGKSDRIDGLIDDIGKRLNVH
ncbi:uncharacterized protein LOC106637159 [Copidosoma floridanum]|uniref:uncharacterized protein LOC106637159 n=1 Tax=Copidosoma floridanum TaxID=29053 RepID=UPI0006C9E508|nr:uncharacterized protein LOC106637159 [Copidosoma floridanum]